MPDPSLAGSSPHGGSVTGGPARLPAAVDVQAAEQDRLLELARVALAVASGACPPARLEEEVGRGRLPVRRAAAFVTLEQRGELRGCMGAMDPEAPAWTSVVEAARWAARDDPRFGRLEKDELPATDIEISILGPLIRLEDPLSFRLGLDGIVVKRNGRRGLLLPEVATMHGMDRIAMLDTCCRKAGLLPRAWRDPASEVWAFRTSRFGGPALAGR